MSGTVKWINLLDPKKVSLYPIQFANVKRLNNNLAVYIFDEVGSGKTISSGIMALDFLESHPKLENERRNTENDVLVITTNSLAKPNNVKIAGQFLGDWFDKLPFAEMGYVDRVRVVNNHYSKFEQKQSYGLVIIDEAHLFLNKDSHRYKYLTSNIKAKKVVFLSATPIKHGFQDLRTYVDIAEALLQKKVNTNWIYRIDTRDQQSEDLICSQFDAKFPVTRYFKDTVKSLQIQGYEKTVAKRYQTKIWRYTSGINKNEVLLENIKSLSRQSRNNRFVVFTRYVEWEAQKIGNYLKSAGFIHSKVELPDQLTYYIVTGRNTQELLDFSAKIGLPTVLILTYQIAEQGLNLPGYNHIINYHIPAYPSALEQRYGRIDRLDSASEAIFNCFLLGSSYFDSNLFNFYSAVFTYLGSLLKYLPSKNSLLSPELLEAYTTVPNDLELYLKQLLNSLDAHTISKIYDYLLNFESSAIEEESSNSSLDLSLDSADEDFKILLGICRDEFSIDAEFLVNRAKAEKILETGIREKIEELLKDINKGSEERRKVVEFLLNNNIWDQVFYQKGKLTVGANYNIGWIDPISECAQLISKDKNYKEYLNYFKQQIRFPMEFNLYRDKLNQYFESAFINNDFQALFPEVVGRCYKENLKDYPMENQDFKLWILDNWDNIEDTLSSLPFFRMVAQFKTELLNFTWTDSYPYYRRDKFSGDVHVFAKAMMRLASRDFGLSRDFYNRYFLGANIEQYKSHFRVPVVREMFEQGVLKKVSEATNWLKLVYHLTRKESLICKLKHNYGGTYTLDYVFTPKPDHVCKRSNNEVSLFHYFILRNSGVFRTWVDNNLIKNIPKAEYIWSNDYWTSGILAVVRNQTFSVKV